VRVFMTIMALAILLPNVARADDRTRFSGTFKYVGGAAEQDARKAAIDRSIDTLFFALRGIARSRLSAGTTIEPWVAFAFDPGHIRVRVPSSPEAIARDDGTPVDYVNDGERTRLTERLADGKLTQLFIAGEGRRLNEYGLSPDGTTLTLKVTITSPKLSAPVLYTLTYRRSA